MTNAASQSAFRSPSSPSSQARRASTIDRLSAAVMTSPRVELIDLLRSDVDLKSRKGEPANCRQGLQATQEPAMSPVDSAKVEVGLLESEKGTSDRRPRSPVRTPAHLRQQLDGAAEESPETLRGHAPSWGSPRRPRGLVGTLHPPP